MCICGISLGISSFVSGQTSKQNFCVDNLVSLWKCVFYLLRVSQPEITTLVRNENIIAWLLLNNEVDNILCIDFMIRMTCLAFVLFAFDSLFKCV